MGEKILFAGDFHGDMNHAGYIVQIAKNNGCEKIVVVGDFGYWPHTDPVYVQQLSRTLRKRGIILCFIDGNHEAFWLQPNPKKPNRVGLTQLNGKHRTEEGFVALSDRVFYIPRGTRWKWGGTVFLGLGGAPSVDKQMRLHWEQQGSTSSKPTGQFTQWWPQELITVEDVKRALASDDHDLNKVDVMVAHDTPTGTIDFATDKKGWEFDQNRRYLKTVVDIVRPNLLIHGHYHIRRDNLYRMGGGRPLRVIGLDRNDSKKESWVVVGA